MVDQTRSRTASGDPPGHLQLLGGKPGTCGDHLDQIRLQVEMLESRDLDEGREERRVVGCGERRECAGDLDQWFPLS